ncbi:DUF2635 domain-containing protein [Serratia fonticola]|uniref:DUF2635 domain-containing protein n=1 Tax=Serratia fonticola TaxID=47917 RepID=UPI001647E729|nr:DUF2635 domain-containing protein [Serratia fonticola]MBC3228357.1 DUF2635 domain-containing protein [Serratia fonticola]
MNKIKIKAAAGVRVPREDNARRYITEQEAVTVPNSAYYQRQIVAGDLVIVGDEDTEAAAITQGKTAKAEVKRGES